MKKLLFFLISVSIILILFSCKTDPTSLGSKENTPPVAYFTTKPDSGDTSTIFEFDASKSVDNEDSTSSLVVRWDWENDGIWDTNFSTNKITSRQFQNEGTKSIALEVKDTGGLTDTVINQLIVSTPNTPPRAKFSVSLTSGTTLTIFEVDASDSWDDEDSTLINVRWDWENDGIWDTDYTMNKTTSHQYTVEGTMRIKLEVQDSGGLTDTVSHQVVVSNAPFTDSTVTDIDGNVYKIVKIGDQYWMAENLKVTHYRNGDAIPHVINNNDWENTTSGAYCAYGNTDSFISTYGLLYNWYAVNDSRNIAPEGWHIPSEAEWNTLISTLGGYDLAGGKMKEAGTLHWDSPNTGATNESGFTALPGGRRWRSGSFQSLNIIAVFWQKDYEFSWDLYYQNDNIGGTSRFKTEGISIRCVKD